MSIQTVQFEPFQDQKPGTYVIDLLSFFLLSASLSYAQSS